MLETWKRYVDTAKVFGALLTDLRKAFDCCDHELFTAKLNAYGFSLPALRLINNYLSNRKHRTQAENTYSKWYIWYVRYCIWCPARLNTRTTAI